MSIRSSMSSLFMRLVLSVLPVLGCHAAGAQTQTQTPAHAPAPVAGGIGTAEQQHARAVGSFRQARFAEAYGRFSALADAGHAPAAAMALWMFLNGPTVLGTDWDSHQDQLTAWALLAGHRVPQMVARSYPQSGATATGARPRR